MSDQSSFTGRTRDRRTQPSVKIADRAARTLISVGGIATILAVLGVFLFLVWVVVPLFLPAEIDAFRSFDRDWPSAPVHAEVDEYRMLGWVLLPDGQLEVFRTDDGSVRQTLPVDVGESGRSLTSWAFENGGGQAVLGFDDGTVQLVEIDFESQVLDVQDLSPDLRRQLDGRPEGTVVNWRDGVLRENPSGQYRGQRLVVRPGETTRLSYGPVHRVGFVRAPKGPQVVALAELQPAPTDDASEDTESSVETVEDNALTSASSPSPGIAKPSAGTPAGSLALFTVIGREKSNFLTGATTLRFDTPRTLPFEPIGEGHPSHLLVSGTGIDIHVGWRSGHLLRIDRSGEAAFVAERGRLVTDGELTSLAFVLGNNTWVWGTDSGRLAAGFPIRIEDFEGDGVDGLVRDQRATTLLVAVKDLARGAGEVLSIAPSARSRLVLAGFADGAIRLYNVTNASQLTRVAPPQPGPISLLAMAPKEDGLIAISPNRIHIADLDPKYSEASFNALFRKAWYEGYSEPIHSWQSSSGTDDFEPKHSLMPLIFGTLKATLYSMLFGAPLALLAAIFTSEFLDPRVRSVVKPTIELMASLPSVVLGFLAALVIAPFVERVVPAMLASFMTLPLTFVIGAYLWQLLPAPVAIRLERARLGFMVLAIPLGVALAAWLGPWLEQALFAGDLRAWLSWDASRSDADPAFASALGGWMFLTLPVAFLATVFLWQRYANPWMRTRGAQWDGRQFAIADLCKFVVGLVTSVLLALVVAWLLGTFGFDPRGVFVDTYVQRNALVVGFVMGFAIIPIIYTLSEDALGSVPWHLRSASLGAHRPWCGRGCSVDVGWRGQVSARAARRRSVSVLAS